MGSSAISERVELAKLCSSRDWSKAIRVIDSLLSQSFAIQDIWFVQRAILQNFFRTSPIFDFFDYLFWWLIDFSLLNVGFSNRAFCYSQLELHKHVIKDCDKALQLDPTLLQAYILKGLSSLNSSITIIQLIIVDRTSIS